MFPQYPQTQQGTRSRLTPKDGKGVRRSRSAGEHSRRTLTHVHVRIFTLRLIIDIVVEIETETPSSGRELQEGAPTLVKYCHDKGGAGGAIKLERRRRHCCHCENEDASTHGVKWTRY
ncbi:hypothetical protein DPEC_G00103280 [Dallia pectoralis]|uniref:Uncharacterized protein n=1 Tax=Dallia pectoralis TaxID=75939 RepID=A0ACC2GX56_DALPE|nr:hypothetical protein DPEC_G00103280 [Dallia pectoralis]